MQRETLFSTQFKLFFGLVIVLKVLMLLLFSSGYQEDLFIPFVMSFLEQGGNPWEYASTTEEAFPYPPLMLYILSFALAPLQYLDMSPGIQPYIQALLYGLPLIISDIIISIILIRMFIWHKTEIFIFYFSSPIILFSTYMHGQLDIIPTALILVSIFTLSKRYYIFSAVFAGFAISTKFHTVAALPLMLIFLINHGRYKESVYMLLVPFLIYTLLSLPYLQGSDDYLYKVIQNKKQTLIFGSFFSVGNVQVYLPLLMTAMIYIRFCAYRKINTDLLYAVTGVLFSTFLLLIEPSPGWYVWMTPFITIFYIRYSDGMQNYFLYGALASLYLLYYLAFYQYEHSKLLYLGEIFIISVPESELPLANIVFTGLQAILLATVYQFYKSGIESNNTYEMQQSFVIGIGGDSGSGKSTLIKQLKGIFSHQLLELEGDSDHKWERDNDNWQQYTHLDPKANTLHRQADQVQLLKNRKSIQRSDYNHDTGKFSEEDTIRPKNFIVLAGLHPFYLPKMRKIIDIKIFLNLDERLRTSWKVQRDQLHRGYTELEVLASIEKRQQDSTRYIQPQKRFSDLTIAFSPTQPDQFEGSIYHGELGLTIEMNASIPLDRVIQAFQKLNCDIVWDYSEDLSHQVVRFNSEPKKLDMNWFVNKYIANAADLINEPIWQTGYAGVTQFIIFYAISEMMKDRRLSNV